MSDSFDFSPTSTYTEEDETVENRMLSPKTMIRALGTLMPKLNGDIPDSDMPILTARNLITSGDQDETYKGILGVNACLLYAIEEKNLEKVKIKLTDGALVNSHCGDQANTPLHLAASVGTSQILSYLLQNGANSNAADVFGRTALYYASCYGHTECVRLLIDAGCDVNKKASLQSIGRMGGGSTRSSQTGSKGDDNNSVIAADFRKIFVSNEVS